MEPYSVRLPPDLKRRLLDAVAREGGRAAPLFEQLLEAYESKREESEGNMAEKFVRARRNVEGHLRALVVTLTADLRDLAAGELLRVDTGCVVAYTDGVDFDIEYVGKVKTALFGGEGGGRSVPGRGEGRAAARRQ